MDAVVTQLKLIVINLNVLNTNVFCFFVAVIDSCVFFNACGTNMHGSGMIDCTGQHLFMINHSAHPTNGDSEHSTSFMYYTK